jgi:hypothetical protein
MPFLEPSEKIRQEQLARMKESFIEFMLYVQGYESSWLRQDESGKGFHYSNIQAAWAWWKAGFKSAIGIVDE